MGAKLNNIRNLRKNKLNVKGKINGKSIKNMKIITQRKNLDKHKKHIFLRFLMKECALFFTYLTIPNVLNVTIFINFEN